MGEYVNQDECVARIETDKVLVDILATHSGVITKYFAEEGDTVDVGAQFIEIDTDAKAPEGGAAPPKKEETPAKVSRSGRESYLILKLNYYFCRKRQLLNSRRNQLRPPNKRKKRHQRSQRRLPLKNKQLVRQTKSLPRKHLLRSLAHALRLALR